MLTSEAAGEPIPTLRFILQGRFGTRASFGRPLHSLGHLLAVAFGFWLYLRSHVESRIHRIGVTLLLWGGLFGAFSRGGWLGALAVYFTYIAAGPRAASRFVKGTSLAIAVAGLIAVSPIGDQILEMIPTFGKPADIYRHRLAERGWELVFAHPFFGNQFPWPEMEDLRQGEGIIDMVNTYLGVALSYGFIGLFCFLSFILLGMTRAYVRARELSHSDSDLALLGASLIACIVGTLIMIDSNSFILGREKMFLRASGPYDCVSRLTKSPPQRPAVLSASNVLRE